MRPREAARHLDARVIQEILLSQASWPRSSSRCASKPALMKITASGLNAEPGHPQHLDHLTHFHAPRV